MDRPSGYHSFALGLLSSCVIYDWSGVGNTMTLSQHNAAKPVIIIIIWPVSREWVRTRGRKVDSRTGIFCPLESGLTLGSVGMGVKAFAQ